MNGRRDEKKKPMLTSLAKSQGIAILGLQETHLNEEETEKLNDRFQKVIIISNSVSTAKEGIAFVLNKEMVNGMKWNHSIIIEGRASRLEIEMGREKGLNIVFIYAPNGNKDKIEFWNELNTKLRRIENLENVIIMGDFNAVEESIDRYPHIEEDEKVQDVWKKVAKGLKVIDRWRMHNPTKTEYTYIQKATNSMSRIDRIYMNKSIYLYGYNWNHI